MIAPLRFFSSGLFLALFVIGCATGSGGGLAGYEPKSASEAGIKKTLMQLEESYNSRDLDGYASCLHENSRYQNSSGKMGPKKTCSNGPKRLGPLTPS